MKRFIVLLLIISIILTGCGGGSKKIEKREFKTVYADEMSSFNYLTTSIGAYIDVISNLVEGLIQFDKYGIVQPCIATDWKLSEDGITWTFNIRKGIKWYDNNGKEYGEVVAQDFVDSAKYILTGENGSSTSNLLFGVIKNAEEYYNEEITDFDEVGVKAIDTYVLEYTLENPVPYFLGMTSYACFLPVSGQFLEEVGDQFATDEENLLYNGPYYMATFEPQSKRVFVANDNYWDKKNIHINKITYVFNKEAETLATELFQRGEVTQAIIPSSAAEQWLNNPDLKDKIRPQATNFWTTWYGFNFEPLFEDEKYNEQWTIAVNNLNFRKSLFHALDRLPAMLTAEPFNAESRIVNTITPKGLLHYKGVDYTEMGGLDKFVATDTFNKDLALEYKEKALSELKGKVKFPIKVVMPYNTGSVDWTNRVQVIEQQMEGLLGKDYIDIDIHPYPPTDFIRSTRRVGLYSMQECTWGPDYADPDTYKYPFYDYDTAYSRVNMAKDYMANEEKSQYELMIEAAAKETIDVEKRYTLFAEAEAFLIDQAFVIPYGVGGGGYVASLLHPFEGACNQFGIAPALLKGRVIMDKPMNTEEYHKAHEKWQKERAEALKKASK